MSSRKRKRRIRFTDRSHPLMGIVSMLMGIFSVCVMITLCFVSSAYSGKAGAYIGVLGIFDVLIAIVGFVLAVRCYPKEDIYRITPALGSVLNGFMVVVGLLLFVIGNV